MILPRPSKKAITKIYDNEYLNRRFQPHAGVDSRIRYSEAYRPTVYAEYAQSLADLGIKKGGVESILDFGCAEGIFLEFCNNYFNSRTTVYGTDLSEDMLGRANGNGLNVISLNHLDSLDMRFDLITLWDVIEHVEDPGAVMSRLKKLLGPGGRMVIQTPRFGLLGELLGEDWCHLLPVQHVSVASKEGMQKLARRTGLKIEKYCSFSADAPSTVVAEPYKRVFDQLAKKLDFGCVQILILRRTI